MSGSKSNKDRPSGPEPPRSDFERVESAAQALRAAAHAWVDFCEAREWDRKQTAFRNFVSNGVSVTFLIQTLAHGRDEEFDEWYAPIRALLKDDQLYRFFWAMRTDSIHVIAPVLGVRPHFTVPNGVVGFKSIQMGPDLKPYIVGVAQDGHEVHFVPDRWTYTVQGLPDQYKDHPFELLMQRYLYQLQDIVRRACSRFAPDIVVEDM